MPKQLTLKAVEAVKSAAIRREIPDGNVSGLYLVVQPSGKKSWAVRYRAAGKPGKLTFGSFPALGLKAARQLASAALERVAAGRETRAPKRRHHGPQHQTRIRSRVSSPNSSSVTRN